MKLNKAMRVTAWTLAALIGLPAIAVAALVGFPGRDHFEFLGSQGPVEWGVVPPFERCWFGYDENGNWESGGESVPPHDARVYVLPARFEDAIITVGAELERAGFTPDALTDIQDKYRSWTHGGTNVTLLRGRAGSWRELMKGRETHAATHVTIYVAHEIAGDWLFHVKRTLNQLEN